MSDYIPFEIQIEIIKKFPVKSLLQFRKVSKSWKSLIDSKQFINDYTDRNRHAQRQHLLIRYINLLHYEHNYLSIADDDTFPEHTFPQIVPESVNLLDENPIDVTVVGSSNGLFCFVPSNSIIDKAVIWNPSVRKSVVVTVPYRDEYGIVGFGVCPNTNDVKIVKINIPMGVAYFEEKICRYWQVDVFSLNSGIWRNPLGDLLSKELHIVCIDSHVAIDRFIYWSGSERIYSTDYCFNTISLIISFDMISEEFMPIYLPDKLARHYYLPMFKLIRESLGLVECKRNADDDQVFKVWVIENGVSNSFKKLYTVKLPFDPVKHVVGLRKNDGLLMESVDDNDDENDDDDDDDDDDDATPAQLVVYEPSSKQIMNLGIYGEAGSFFMSSYTESLLLLNQPSTITGGHVEGN